MQHLLCMKFSIRNSNQFEFVPQQKQILAIETKIYLKKVLHKVLLAWSTLLSQIFLVTSSSNLFS